MASLNLTDWRNPSLPLLLRRHCRHLVIFSLIGALLVACYYYNFEPRLIQIQRQTAQLATELTSFEKVAAQAHAIEQQRVVEAQQVASNQQHAEVLHDFANLFNFASSGIQVSSIHWLHRELKVSGEFVKAQHVQVFEERLEELLNGADMTVQFLPPRQFTIQAIFESAP